MATNGEARESPEPVRGEALRRRAIPRKQDPVFLDPAMPEAHSLAFAFQVPCLSKPLRFCFYDMTSRRLRCLSGPHPLPTVRTKQQSEAKKGTFTCLPWPSGNSTAVLAQGVGSGGHKCQATLGRKGGRSEGASESPFFSCYAVKGVV